MESINTNPDNNEIDKIALELKSIFHPMNSLTNQLSSENNTIKIPLIYFFEVNNIVQRQDPHQLLVSAYTTQNEQCYIVRSDQILFSLQKQNLDITKFLIQYYDIQIEIWVDLPQEIKIISQEYNLNPKKHIQLLLRSLPKDSLHSEIEIDDLKRDLLILKEGYSQLYDQIFQFSKFYQQPSYRMNDLQLLNQQSQEELKLDQQFSKMQDISEKKLDLAYLFADPLIYENKDCEFVPFDLPLDTENEIRELEKIIASERK